MMNLSGGSALRTGVAASDRVFAIAANLDDPIANDIGNQPAMHHADAAVSALRFNWLGRHGMLLQENHSAFFVSGVQRFLLVRSGQTFFNLAMRSAIRIFLEIVAMHATPSLKLQINTKTIEDRSE